MNNKDSEEKALYSSRIIDNYIKLIKVKYSFIDVDELLHSAGMETYQVADEDSWFTQSQINKFQKKLSELTNNKSIAREAGAYAASPDTLGSMRRYVLGFVGPRKAYELIGNYSSKFTRSATFSSKKISANKVEIIVKPKKGVIEQPFQCENRLGFFEAISTAFNYNLPQIEHPECIFHGGQVCKYIVTWDLPLSITWRKARFGAALTLIGIGTISLISFPIFISAIAISAFIILLLLMTLRISSLDNVELINAVENLHQSSDELTKQISINYENSLLINEIGQALSKENDLDGITSQVMNVLRHRLDYDRGLILLANKEKTRLVSRAGFGYSLDELSKFMMSSGFHLDKKDSKGIFINCFHQQKSFLINNIDEIKDDLSQRSLEFARRMGVKSFICCPIIFEKESLGVLAVDNIKTKRPLVERDINLLMGIAPQVAVSIYNLKLVEARLRQFQSILQTLVASTEARDPITAGHSEKVTEYAVGICNQLRLPTDFTDMIRVAASLHDYGKIGVDDAILKKPGRLTQEEYDYIKTHALKTRDILERANFEGIYKEVPEVASSHHEKLDGTGYPNGLTEDEIPFGGKIIAVADVFEALTSRRHYREPMPTDEALDHLVKNIGNHFDKSCVEALINYYNSNVSQIPYKPRGDFLSLKVPSSEESIFED